MKNKLEGWPEIKSKWIWNIGHVDDSKLAVEMALFSKNPDLLIGRSQHLLILDKQWNIN